MFKGSIVAIVTPFKDGRLDEETLTRLVEYHIESGTSGIVPCGTTGESPTLSHDEHNRVIEICITAAQGRVPVIAGTGSNSTREAIALTRHAAKAGADAALVVSPYYNKPMQEGLYQHYRAIAESTGIPIIIYNIAGRTACNIEPETMARLAHDCKSIIGVKEASGSLAQAQLIKMMCPDDFIILSGDDILTLPILGIGGQGVISVLANVLPREVGDVVRLYFEGHIEEARQKQYSLIPLMRAMFLETNPIPVKKAMFLLGRCSEEVRLPLSSLSAENTESLRQELQNFGLL